MKDSAEYVVKLRAESVNEENSQQAHDTEGGEKLAQRDSIGDGYRTCGHDVL